MTLLKRYASYPNKLKKGKYRDISISPDSRYVATTYYQTEEIPSSDFLKDYKNELSRNITASKLGVSPKVVGIIKDPGYSRGFISEHGGETLGKLQTKLTPQQAYYIGHRTARQRTRLKDKANLIHTDLHEQNIVIPPKELGRKKPRSRFIDWEAAQTPQYFKDNPDNDWLSNVDISLKKNMPVQEAFDIGFESRRTFTSSFCYMIYL